MNLINVDEMKKWLKENESAFRAETDIIEEKIALGINGLEWLVLQVAVDDIRISSLNSLLEFCKRIYQKDFENLIKDAVNMDPDSFYEKHELNWWIVIEDALTHLAILKKNNYDMYFNLLQWMYNGEFID